MSGKTKEKELEMKNLLKKLWVDERGQSTTEYILILSVVVMVALKFKTLFSSKLKTLTDKLGDQMENAIEDQ